MNRVITFYPPDATATHAVIVVPAEDETWFEFDSADPSDAARWLDAHEAE